ncbi:copper-translocating P-type ATPase [Oceanispirochaeta crateris]|uniref:Copper-translocating P-type ATPase n=1 Tax=Oceanispirochaeta crateris TaxID=2518645 RepID=A0A5C1QH24_9SPIO|nr:copper-translocating P-type ATPase [Oceanispirochaeta crateris]QEN06787.1 copper-translocating P-type ATPase [Oceanispirochaeta crateris]
MKNNDMNHEHMNHQKHDQHSGHQHQGHSGHHDHNAHHRMMIQDFKKRFYITLVLTLPVLALSPLIQKILGFSFGFPGSGYVVFALASIIFLYGGWPFLSGLVKELKDKSPGMMTLIGLAITVAYVYSAAVTFGLDGTPFYWELATLIAIMLAGHWIEMASILGASSALEKLAKLMPSEAHRKKDDEVEDIPLSEVKKGDVLVIKPGEKIPSDGVVLKGESYINESMLTGESKPVRKGKDDRLIGGSLNGDGSLELRVEGAGDESYLNKVIKMVGEAQASKSKTQALSDRAAFWLTIVSLSVGIATLITWLLVGQDLQFAIARMATVMIITCPHALGLAIPLVVAVSTAKSAENGLLIQNRTAFENARKISTVIFDKTGTLTTGTFEVTSVDIHDKKYGDKELLTFAGSVEALSEHPIGKSIVLRAKKDEIDLPAVDNFQAVKGKGVSGTVSGKKIQIVSPGYLQEQNLEIPEGAEAKGGVTRIFILVQGKVAGSLALSDTIRPESYQAIKALQKLNIKCWMLTGDNKETAKAVADELGMDGFFAEVLPDEKQAKVKELQAQGEYVAMAGDGVNDSPALAQAQVGIAVGSGTDIAAASADIILVNSNPLDITALILFGKATYNKMVQNLIWATGYNVIAIPLAAGVLYNVGIVMRPEVGAILMSASTVIVAVNARLLRVKKEELKEAGK